MSCLACDLGVTHYSSAGINRATQRVDGDDMRCLLIPWPVLLPVACRDLLPRVVEVDRLLKVLHCVVVCVIVCRSVSCEVFFSGASMRVRRSS